MQKSGALKTPTQNDTPFFAAFFSPAGQNSSNGTNSTNSTKSPERKHSSPNVLHKEPSSRYRSGDGRKPSSDRKASVGSPNVKRRASSSASAANGGSNGAISGGRVGFAGIVTDDAVPPALPPDFALLAKGPPRLGGNTDAVIPSPASVDSFSKMLARTTSNTASSSQLAPPAALTAAHPSESSVVHQHIQEMANKRISTLDYLRKAHEGRVYWFNTLLFDQPSLSRMPYFDPRRLSRRATNYLLLGLSLPTVIDLNSSTPLEFLRSLNTLLSEFDTFQQLHPETGSSNQSSLSRAARLPSMFRRATNRRTSSSAAADFDPAPDHHDADYGPLANHPAQGVHGSAGGSVISFAHSDHNADLLPGEEYTHLLTPSLPFDPDYFETFATLCDVLIDCYSRLLSLVATPSVCTHAVGELFSKADGRIRKIIIQGCVKEFEDYSRQGVKAEVASVGKVVLGGLM